MKGRNVIWRASAVTSTIIILVSFFGGQPVLVTTQHLYYNNMSPLNGPVRHRSSPRSSDKRQSHTDHIVIDLEDPQQPHDGRSHSSPRSSPAASRVVASFLIVTGIAMIFLGSLDVISERRQVQVQVSPSSASESSPISSSLRTTTKNVNAKPSLTAAQAANIVQNKQHEIKHRQITECGIWMAPSSLVPFPGFGIFTTREISMRESILHQPDAVSIPLHDMKRRRDMPLRKERRDVWFNVFSNVRAS